MTFDNHDTEHTIRELEQAKILLSAMSKFLLEKINEINKFTNVEPSIHLAKEKEQIKFLTSQIISELNGKQNELENLAEVLAHELKTPLVPVKAYTSMLLSESIGELNELQKEKIQMMASGVDRLQELVNDMLYTKRIKLGQLKLNKKIVNISQIIEKVLVLLKEKADKKSIILDSNTSEEINCYCDPEMIEVVFIKVIENSINAVSKNGGTVSINSIDDNKTVTVTIADNGPGIIDEISRGIFTKFYQPKIHLNKESGGLGLGLYLAHQIMQAHRGKIKIKGLSKRGSTAYISIPKR